MIDMSSSSDMRTIIVAVSGVKLRMTASATAELLDNTTTNTMSIVSATRYIARDAPEDPPRFINGAVDDGQARRGENQGRSTAGRIGGARDGSPAVRLLQYRRIMDTAIKNAAILSENNQNWRSEREWSARYWRKEEESLRCPIGRSGPPEIPCLPDVVRH